MYNRQDDRLFRQFHLHSTLQSKEKNMLDEIDRIDDNLLLNTSPDDLSSDFENKYRIDVPHLKENEISVSEPNDIKIEVGRRNLHNAFDEDGPSFVSGTTFQIFIPFEGDEELFKCQPSNSSGPPHAKVNKSEIVITYIRTDHDAANVKGSIAFGVILNGLHVM